MNNASEICDTLRDAGVIRACASVTGTTEFHRELPGFLIQEDVYSAHCRCASRVHTSCCISYVVRGSYTDISPCGMHRISAGTLSLYPEGERHGRQAGAEGARVLTLIVSEFGKQLLSFHALNLEQRRTIHCGTAQRAALKLLQELGKCRASTSLRLHAMTIELISTLEDHCTKKPTMNRQAWLLEVKKLLHSSFLQSFSLRKLASHANVHPIHLARTFRNTYGCTIGEYVRELRIESACRYLIDSDLSITEIALRSGFADHSHFCRVFRQQVGMSPSLFRRNRYAFVAEHVSDPTAERFSG
jgi:AraC family transcriptional regulator